MRHKKLTIKRKNLKVAKGNRGEINIFDLGTLVQLETHCWIGSKRLPKEIAKEIGHEGWIRANKNLINRNKLKDLRAYIHEARQTIWLASLPFPIKGIFFLPIDKRKEVNEKLKEIKENFDAAAEVFSEQYEDHIADASDNLEELFDMADYPQNIRNRFDIQWRFFEMTIPSGITDEVRAEESKRFKAMMEQTKELGILALREGFAEIVNHLNETLSGKLDGEKRRVRQDSIDKVTEFFTEFQNKNVFKDVELERIIKSAKEVVAGVTPKDLNSDTSLTKMIHVELNEISGKLDGSIEKVRRKLSW